MGLHPGVVVARGLEVGPHRDAHGAVLALLEPQGEREAGRDAVRGDDDGGAQLVLVARAAPVLVERACRDTHDAARALVEQGARHVGALEQLGARALRVLGERLVEVHARAGEPVGRVGLELGPGQLPRASARDDAQALVADPAVLGAGGDAHAHELADGPRGQPVAADLVAREGGLLEEEDVQARRGAVVRGRGPCWARTDDDDVRIIIPVTHVLTSLGKLEHTSESPL
ncbi:hypothetical protein D3C74_342840 [compost metagenome]